jgi:chromosome segregation ATPase
MVSYLKAKLSELQAWAHADKLELARASKVLEKLEQNERTLTNEKKALEKYIEVLKNQLTSLNREFEVQASRAMCLEKRLVEADARIGRANESALDWQGKNYKAEKTILDTRENLTASIKRFLRDLGVSTSELESDNE